MVCRQISGVFARIHNSTRVKLIYPIIVIHVDMLDTCEFSLLEDVQYSSLMLDCKSSRDEWDMITFWLCWLRSKHLVRFHWMYLWTGSHQRPSLAP